MGGMTFSDMGTLPATYTSSPSTGYHAGIFFNTYLGRKFDIQPQLLYTNLGATLTQSIPYQLQNVEGWLTSISDIKLSYIQIPIVFVYRFRSEWNIHGGPYIGFLLADKEQILETFTYSSQSLSADTATNSTKGDYKIDVGLTLGIGYQLQSGIGLSLGYSFGLTNTFESQSGIDPNNGQNYHFPSFATNNFFTFSISYLFGH
jgi:hypothetical protein